MWLSDPLHVAAHLVAAENTVVHWWDQVGYSRTTASWQGQIHISNYQGKNHITYGLTPPAIFESGLQYSEGR